MSGISWLNLSGRQLVFKRLDSFFAIALRGALKDTTPPRDYLVFNEAIFSDPIT
jgi:hypothetical protein